ncbi:MAG: DegT/DnrJ/EryC1/StrS family aminotransferase [Methanophagales archaeon]|nr:DegT/DnrJ/EryC1/StrS family aminotransferase [Methanophagales archaeon]RLG29589.1 MAG: transcriptional regulator [Methanosarcinales archaeon]
MKVPFLDLKRQYESIKEEINEAIQTVLESQQFILGPQVEEFERRIANYCNAKHAIGVASGTDALLLSLKASGISGGVVTTPFTFFATAGAIHNAGATPIFADIEPDTYNIDAEEVKKLLGSKSNKMIRAIIPVHLFGQAADMDAIMKIAEEHDLVVIEDAAQAIGEEYNGKKVGSMSIGCFSFFPSKNLGGYGDGGLITTNDDELADKIRTLRMHGAKPKYYHHVIGYNTRLDTIQAAILAVKLNHLEEWTTKRRDNARFYSKALSDITEDELELPQIAEGRKHIFNQYTIRVKNGRRDNLKEFLEGQGISTAIYYPLPLHLQPCFSFLGYKRGDFPVAEEASKEVLSLPVYPDLEREEREYVVKKILEFFEVEKDVQ